MNGLLPYYLGHLGWLVCTFVVLSISILIVKRSAPASILNPLKKIPRVIITARNLFFCAVVFMAGWAARDLSQFHHTYVLNDINVLERVTNDEYVMAFKDTGLKFRTKFCQDYVPGFREGSRLKVIVYEDRGSCWSISSKKLGYIIDR